MKLFTVLSQGSAPFWIGGGLVVFGLLLYWIWFRPSVSRLYRELAELSAQLNKPDLNWLGVQDGVKATLQGRSGSVFSAWKETTQRVVPLSRGAHSGHYLFGGVHDIWTTPRLLNGHLFAAVAEAVPNLFVGTGLLLTFFFLTVSLDAAADLLAAPQADGTGSGSATILAASRGLLGAVGAKFVTSLAGLFVSLVWTWRSKVWMSRLQNCCANIADHISRLAPPSGAERVAFQGIEYQSDLNRIFREAVVQFGSAHAEHGKHLESLAINVQSALQTQAQAITATLESLHKPLSEQLEVAQEMLREVQDQSATFKRFETDLAVTLAGAVTSAVSPELERMTSRLSLAIEGLSERMGTMNQEALERMLSDFSSMITQATQTEVEEIKATLSTLGTGLSTAGEELSRGVQQATENLKGVSGELAERIERSSKSLAEGAVMLDAASGSVNESVKAMDRAVSQVAELGVHSAVFVRETLDRARNLVKELEPMSAELSKVAKRLEDVGHSVANAIDGVEEVTAEQRALVSVIENSVPEAMKAIDRIQDSLQSTIKVVEGTMGQAQNSMTETATTLKQAVTQITTGVREYSEQVAALHLEMDSQMAKAVSGLSEAVSGIEDLVEEALDKTT